MTGAGFTTDAWSSGVYRELRGLAAGRLARLTARPSLRPTELVHEAFLRLGAGSRWHSRAHFFGAAARAIRNALVDHLRSKRRLKRDGGLRRVSISRAGLVDPRDVLGRVALDRALARLERHDRRCAKTVVLRVVAGLTVPEIAEALSVSTATVERDWTYARAWLYRELTGTSP